MSKNYYEKTTSEKIVVTEEPKYPQGFENNASNNSEIESAKIADPEQQAWIEELRKIRMHSSEQFDKLMVMLASGGLVLSVGFVKDIVKLNESQYQYILIISWIAFVFTLLINLISHLISVKVIDLELEEQTKKSDSLNSKLITCNYLSIITLVIAISAFVIFVSLNL